MTDAPIFPEAPHDTREAEGLASRFDDYDAGEPPYVARRPDAGEYRDGQPEDDCPEGWCLYVRADLPRPGTSGEWRLERAEYERDAALSEMARLREEAESRERVVAAWAAARREFGAHDVRDSNDARFQRWQEAEHALLAICPRGTSTPQMQVKP